MADPTRRDFLKKMGALGAVAVLADGSFGVEDAVAAKVIVNKASQPGLTEQVNRDVWHILEVWWMAQDAGVWVPATEHRPHWNPETQKMRIQVHDGGWELWRDDKRIYRQTTPSRPTVCVRTSDGAGVWVSTGEVVNDYERMAYQGLQTPNEVREAESYDADAADVWEEAGDW